MQQKMAAGESPAAEMIKSVSLIIAGLLLLLPGFFTDFLGLLLLLPPVQKHLTMKLMPHLRFSRMPGGGFSAGTGGGETFEGEFQRKDEQRDRLDHKGRSPRLTSPGPVSRCDRAACSCRPTRFPSPACAWVKTATATPASPARTGFSSRPSPAAADREYCPPPPIADSDRAANDNPPACTADRS